MGSSVSSHKPSLTNNYVYVVRAYDQDGKDVTLNTLYSSNIDLSAFWKYKFMEENTTIQTITFVFEDRKSFTFNRGERVKLPKKYKLDLKV